MEIQIGEYVRTKKGKIFKYGKGRAYLGKDNEITNHSFEPIDLVKAGDYVNGVKVIKILDGFAEGTMEIWLENNTKIYRHHIEDIKSIVTKEQFSSIEYRLDVN